MDAIQQISKDINQVASNFNKIVDDFIKSHESGFVDIVHSQLSKGQDGDGKTLSPEYQSPVYGAAKKALGAFSSTIPDLNLEGDFYEGMQFDSTNTFIESTDWKWDKLRTKYGNAITDLQQKNLDQYVNEQMIPEFEELLFNLMFKGV